MKNEILMMSKFKVGDLLTSILIISVLGILLLLILNRNQKLKYLKKMTSVALILTMLLLPFSNLLNVKAEAVTITTNDTKLLASDNNFKYVTNKAKLTISGNNETDTFIAYKILDVYYNETTNEMTYDFTTDFKGFLSKLDSADDFYNLTIEDYQKLTSDNENGTADYNALSTTSTLNKLVSKYATYIKKANGTITGITSFIQSETDNKKLSTKLTTGSYLVLPIQSKTLGEHIEQEEKLKVPTFRLYAYGVGVANAVFNSSNGYWELSDCIISTKSMYEKITSWLINESLSEILSFGQADATYSASKELYLVTFRDGQDDKIPTNTHSSILNNADIMKQSWQREYIFPTGVTVSKILIPGEDVELYIKGNGVYYTFNDKEYKLCDIETKDNLDSSRSIILSNLPANFSEWPLAFKLEINDEIKVKEANAITTKIRYIRDAYVDITGMTQSEAEQAVIGTTTISNTIYTYGINIKNDSKDITALNGGEFELYTDEECTNKVGSKITITNNGTATIKGISDTLFYYLKQVKAPAGYKLLETPIKISKDSSSLTDGYYNITITNTKMGLLPSTGGLGTILYTTFGLLIIVVGSIAFVSYRKKQLQNN